MWLVLPWPYHPFLSVPPKMQTAVTSRASFGNKEKVINSVCRPWAFNLSDVTTGRRPCADPRLPVLAYLSDPNSGPENYGFSLQQQIWFVPARSRSLETNSVISITDDSRKYLEYSWNSSHEWSHGFHFGDNAEIMLDQFYLKMFWGGFWPKCGLRQCFPYRCRYRSLLPKPPQKHLP